MKAFDYQAILFDLDGTLVETAPEICDAVNDTLLELGLSTVALDLVRDWIGHGTGELLVQALAYVKKIDAASIRANPQFARQTQIFDKHYHARCGTRSQLYPHVAEALKQLRTRGIKLAVVTNKESKFTQTVMQQMGLTDLMDRTVCGDTFSVKKPNPTGVQSLLRDWGIHPSKALFVGDSSIDAATAKNAAVTVWLLPYGYNMGRPIEESKPDRVIKNFSVFLTE